MANHEIKEASDGSFYFVVKGANGEVIATSETYSTKSNAERGVKDFFNVVAEEGSTDASDS